MQLDWGTLLTSVLSSAGFSGLVVYILRNWIIHEFKKDVENHKHILQIDIIKAQLQSKEVISTYQEMYEKIEVAFGATSKLVSMFRVVNNYSKCNENDIEKILVEYGATDLKTQQIKALFASNATNKVQAMNDYLEVLLLSKANEQQRETKNYIIIKALYLQDEIEKLGLEIVNKISGSIISYETGVSAGDMTLKRQAKQEADEIPEMIDELKSKMKNVLTPEALK